MDALDTPDTLDIIMPEPQLADNVVSLRHGAPDAPIRRFGLVGLTRMLNDMEVGSGILIPALPDWTDSEVHNLRNRINTVVFRVTHKAETADNFIVRTTVRGFEIWRLPNIPDPSPAQV